MDGTILRIPGNLGYGRLVKTSPDRSPVPRKTWCTRFRTRPVYINLSKIGSKVIITVQPKFIFRRKERVYTCTNYVLRYSLLFRCVIGNV